MNKYELMAYAIFSLYENWLAMDQDFKYKNYIINLIRVMIIEIGNIQTNLYSLEAIEDRKPVNEHFYPRIESARKIFHCMEKGVFKIEKIDRLVKFIKSRCRVHKITFAQHTKLTKIQKENPELHWKQHYRLAGIELKRHEKHYIIDGIEYKNYKDIMAAFSIVERTVQRRFNDDKKYPNWRRNRI